MGSRQTEAYPPVFIVAANGSGTQVLRHLLNAHSRIAVLPEMKYFGGSISQYMLEQWRAPDVERAEFEEKIDEWLQQRKHVFEPVPFEAVQRAALNTETNFRDPYEAVATVWANYHEAALWGERTPTNLLYVDIIAQMFPAARFIYLVRDPRAVVYSMNTMPYFTDDPILNAYNWKDATTKGLALMIRAVPSEQRMIVQFERLVQEPEATLRAVTDFLDLEFEPAMQRLDVPLGTLLPGSIEAEEGTWSGRGDRSASYKQALGTEGAALVEKICGGPMKGFGYETEQHRLAMRARIALMLKSLYWRGKRYQHKDDRNFAVKFSPLARFRS